MKKVRKSVKITVVSGSVLLLIGTLAHKYLNDSQIVQHKALSADVVDIINDKDEDGTISKGDTVTIRNVDANADGKTDEFQVLKTDGNKITLLASDLYKSSCSGMSVNTAYVDGSYFSRYDGSLFDTAAESYFNYLPDTVRAAIVPQELEQSVYYYEWGNDDVTQACNGDALLMYKTTDEVLYVAEHADEINLTMRKIDSFHVGTRYVYVPDIDDILDYYDGDLDRKEIRDSSDQTKVGASNYMALRSSFASFADRVSILNKRTGNFNDMRFNVNAGIYPEFILELSN